MFLFLCEMLKNPFGSYDTSTRRVNVIHNERKTKLYENIDILCELIEANLIIGRTFKNI